MSARFRIIFEGQSDLTLKEMYPDGVPKEINIKKDMEGVTISELLNDWALMFDLKATVQDLSTKETLEITEIGTPP